MITVNGREIKFETFPNGETRMIAESFPQFGYVIEEVGFKYESDRDLVKLLMVKEYIKQVGYGDYGNLLMYYMPYSRMDRSENGSPFTLKYISNFINGLGFRKVRIIEPHSDVTPALINNSESLYINFDLIEKVKTEVGFNQENDFLVFPDAGAQKRYSKMKAKNILTCNKVRDFETGEIKGLDLIGDTSQAGGRRAIIVDDLSSYGGTFVHTSKRLKQEGFAEVYLLVAHAENSIFGGALFLNVDKVFTTDSILTEQAVLANMKFAKQLAIYPITDLV